MGVGHGADYSVDKICDLNAEPIKGAGCQVTWREGPKGVTWLVSTKSCVTVKVGVQNGPRYRVVMTYGVAWWLYRTSPPLIDNSTCQVYPPRGSDPALGAPTMDTPWKEFVLDSAQFLRQQK